MIITTTMHIENKPVQEYKGIVFGEVVEGRNFVKDFMSGIRDIVGGRSGSYEDSLMNARKAALDEMSQRASKLGANAIIGVSFQYSTVGAQNGMLMITCNGTAVVVTAAGGSRYFIFSRTVGRIIFELGFAYTLVIFPLTGSSSGCVVTGTIGRSVFIFVLTTTVNVTF